MGSISALVQYWRWVSRVVQGDLKGINKWR
jgi:hypothetical protein